MLGSCYESLPQKERCSLFCFEIYLFILRDRENRSTGGAEREERARIPSRLHTVSTDPSAGLEIRNHEIMTPAEVGHLTE